MDPVRNPFAPGAGTPPPELAGRDDLRETVRIALERVRLGLPTKSILMIGLRGVGKTVLLNELLERVGHRGWISAKVEAGASESLSVALSQSLLSALRTATGRHPEGPLRRLLGVFKAFSLRVDPAGNVSLGIDVEPVQGVADTGRFADDLAALFETLGETARDLEIGALVLVDELQEAVPDELAALNTAAHHIGQGAVPLPVVIVGAGSPSLPAQLSEATSYAERLYDYRPIGLLHDDAARQALTVPAQDKGVVWAPEGLTMAVDTAGGYPYFIQAIGKHVWDNARTSPISVEDVEVGLVAARREVDDGLYRSRWERATPAQRDLLRALADLAGDGAAGVAEIAQAMGKRRTSDISVARNELIKKGLTYAPERGFLAFTVPGMHEFILSEP